MTEEGEKMRLPPVYGKKNHPNKERGKPYGKGGSRSGRRNWRKMKGGFKWTQKRKQREESRRAGGQIFQAGSGAVKRLSTTAEENEGPL